MVFKKVKITKDWIQNNIPMSIFYESSWERCLFMPFGYTSRLKTAASRDVYPKGINTQRA
jgi:hypothetical protein